MARCGWFPVAVHRSTRLGSGSVARPDPRATPLTAHGRSLFQTGAHVCALRAVRRRPTRSRFAPGAEPPAAERVMQETSNLRASSLYSLAWVRDSDKLPHSARGQHVDVRRMISARLRVPPLWCRVRAGITRSTREDLSAQSTHRCLHRTPTPGWIPAPALCVGVGVGVGAAVEGSRPGPGAGRRMIAGQQGAVQNDSTKICIDRG